jgi:hypothetical protein
LTVGFTSKWNYHNEMSRQFEHVYGAASAVSRFFRMIGRKAGLLYKRTPIVLSLIVALFCLSSAASQVELVPGKPQQGALAAGKKQSYVLSLTAGDFVQVGIETHGAEFVFIVYGPSGSKIRGFKIGPENANVNFVTKATGPHRIEIALSENTADVNYSITVTKIAALKDRLAAAPTEYESPRIKALRATVESAQQGSVEKFWDDLKKEGAPLMEPLQGDDHNMLVTFLLEGHAGHAQCSVAVVAVHGSVARRLSHVAS